MHYVQSFIFLEPLVFESQRASPSKYDQRWVQECLGFSAKIPEHQNFAELPYLVQDKYIVV